MKTTVVGAIRCRTHEYIKSQDIKGGRSGKYERVVPQVVGVNAAGGGNGAAGDPFANVCGSTQDGESECMTRLGDSLESAEGVGASG